LGKLLITIFLIFLMVPCSSEAQTSSYSQFWNEIQLSRTFGDKWASEINAGSTFSSTPSEKSMFSSNIQLTGRIWAHYYLSPRWKLSAFLAYYSNKEVPEIGQYKAPEWRFALQGIYYFHKIGYTLSTRMRGELRYISDSDGVFRDAYRYRQQFKLLVPLNNKVLRKGVVYLITSDELFIKSASKTTGLTFFDRNRFTLGAGYLVTNDIQIELAYVNEYLPRDKGNEMYHALSVTLSFNNLLPNIKKLFTRRSADTDHGD
jgi:hypothetical protein